MVIQKSNPNVAMECLVFRDDSTLLYTSVISLIVSQDG